MGQDEAFLLEGQSQKERKSNDGMMNLTWRWRPFDWFRKLSDVLHWSFVLSVVIVYGINQGLSLGLSRISIQYYMKDEQKLQPSEAQIFTGIISLPWIVKPLWGLLTDVLPIAGYRRRPYFILAGTEYFLFFQFVPICSLAVNCVVNLFLEMLQMVRCKYEKICITLY